MFGVVSLFIIFLLSLICSLHLKVKREMKERVELEKNREFLFKQGNVEQLNPDCTADEQAELLPYDPSWEIEKEYIKLGMHMVLNY